VIVAMKRHGLAHSGRRSVESLGVEAVRRSKVGWAVGQTSRVLERLLQWDLADIAAVGARGLARRARRDSQEEEAARRRHTWVGAGRHRAKQCGRGRKPASGRRLE